MEKLNIWLFVKNGNGNGEMWSWRKATSSGMILETADDIPDYGKAIHTALNRGFRPMSEYWIVKTHSYISYFEPKSRTHTVLDGAVPPEISRIINKARK
jgi:hypothetical protein